MSRSYVNSSLIQQTILNKRICEITYNGVFGVGYSCSKGEKSSSKHGFKATRWFFVVANLRMKIEKERPLNHSGSTSKRGKRTSGIPRIKWLTTNGRTYTSA